jgi:CheY-like chemotaxis protein
VQLAKAPIELATVVAQAIERVAPLIEARQHRLEVVVPPEGLLVEGDLQRLTQVLANLLDNAAKYTPSGGRIDVTAWEDGDFVAISVRDDGMGIAAGLLPSLFDTFVQGPRAGDRAEGGLGLGLSIVRSLVRLHGGSVAAYSDGAGKGTELVVRLPLARRRRWNVVAGLPRLGRPHGRGARVLVVDDNVDAAETMGELLATLGCDAQVAHDGPAALATAGAAPPALVLLDLGLPLMDGYEVARRLRRLPALAQTRIVALTGYGQAADRERTHAAGFDGHLLKPLGIEELHALVAALGDAVAAEDGAQLRA